MFTYVLPLTVQGCLMQDLSKKAMLLIQPNTKMFLCSMKPSSSSYSAAWNTPAAINDHIYSELGHRKQNLVTNDFDCRRPLHFWLIAFLVNIRSKEEYCFESYVCVAADSPAALDQTTTLLFQRAAHKRHFSDTRTPLYCIGLLLHFGLKSYILCLVLS